MWERGWERKVPVFLTKSRSWHCRNSSGFQQLQAVKDVRRFICFLGSSYSCPGKFHLREWIHSSWIRQAMERNMSVMLSIDSSTIQREAYDMSNVIQSTVDHIILGTLVLQFMGHLKWTACKWKKVNDMSQISCKRYKKSYILFTWTLKSCGCNTLCEVANNIFTIVEAISHDVSPPPQGFHDRLTTVQMSTDSQIKHLKVEEIMRTNSRLYIHIC